MHRRDLAKDQTGQMYLITSRSKRLLAVAATSAILLAGCSTSGSSDAATSTTKPKVSSTTELEKTTTTTEVDAPADGPSSSDLEALLPTADDLGPDWSVDDSVVDSAEDDASDKALDEQCPDAAALTQNGSDKEDEVKANFQNDDSSAMEVSLTSSATDLSDKDLQTAVDAINDCDDVTVTDSDGVTTTFSFEADLDPDYGDQGIRLQAEVTLDGGTIPQPVSLMVYAVFFRYGSAGVSITGTDGIDQETFETIDVDTDLLLQLADDLDQQVSDLVD